MKKKEYLFPPQLGQVNIYFGYTGWEWLILGLGGVMSLYVMIETMNMLSVMPIILFALLCFKPLPNRSLSYLLIRAYVYFIAQPMLYDYMEEQEVLQSEER